MHGHWHSYCSPASQDARLHVLFCLGHGGLEIRATGAVSTAGHSRPCSGERRARCSPLLQRRGLLWRAGGWQLGICALLEPAAVQSTQALPVTLSLSPPQRSPSACGSAAAAWRSSPAAVWGTCSGSSIPTLSPGAAAPSLPGKWLRG